MNITLPPELEEYVQGKVRSGLYDSVGEVVSEGLRLLREREELHQHKLARLRGELQIGIDAADQGRVRPFDESTLEEAEVAGRELLRAKQARYKP